MKRVEKQRKPLVFRVGLEGGTPCLQVVTEDPVESLPVEQVQLESEAQELPDESQIQLSEASQEPVAVEVPVNTDAIFVNRDGTVTGPFTEKELRRHWANGVIHSDDYVWREGLAEWSILGSYFGVPVLSSHSTSIAGLSQRRMEYDEQGDGGFLQSKVVLPVLFSVLSMLSALFFVIVMPENISYFIGACSLSLILALVACIAGRKLSLVFLMMVNVLLPVFAWYYLVQDRLRDQPPGETVEQKEENFPASTTQQMTAKKV